MFGPPDKNQVEWRKECLFCQISAQILFKKAVPDMVEEEEEEDAGVYFREGSSFSTLDRQQDSMSARLFFLAGV